MGNQEIVESVHVPPRAPRLVSEDRLFFKHTPYRGGPAAMSSDKITELSRDIEILQDFNHRLVRELYLLRQ